MTHDALMDSAKIVGAALELDLDALRQIVMVVESPLGQMIAEPFVKHLDGPATIKDVEKVIAAVKLTIFYCEELKKLGLDSLCTS